MQILNIYEKIWLKIMIFKFTKINLINKII